MINFPDFWSARDLQWSPRFLKDSSLLDIISKRFAISLNWSDQDLKQHHKSWYMVFTNLLVKNNNQFLNRYSNQFIEILLSVWSTKEIQDLLLWCHIFFMIWKLDLWPIRKAKCRDSYAIFRIVWDMSPCKYVTMLHKNKRIF